jgi:hypothetical protein
MLRVLILAAVLSATAGAQESNSVTLGTVRMSGQSVQVQRYGADSVKVIARAPFDVVQTTIALVTLRQWLDTASQLVHAPIMRPAMGQTITLESPSAPLHLRRAITSEGEHLFLTFTNADALRELQLPVNASDLDVLLALMERATRLPS